MSQHPILAQVVLGYSPMIDRERAVTATRLTVFPARPDAALDAGALLAAVAEVWPEGAGRVSLNVVSETLLHDLMLARPSPNLMIEVPAFMAADLAHSEAISGLYARGNTLMLKGRPRHELPRDLLPCFKHSIIDLDDECRRRPAWCAPSPTCRPACARSTRWSPASSAVRWPCSAGRSTTRSSRWPASRASPTWRRSSS
jgi:c-di-GMP phosphodiesterase